MLSLSKKFFNQIDYLSEGYKVAFNPNKNKLTFYKAEKATQKITNLQKITNHVNELQKPIFSEINSYINCHKKLKEINGLIEDKNRTSINLEAFNENLKPSSAELKELVWAVHATNILPKDSISPVSVNALTQEIILGITNTTHFALGELVRPHHGFTWENRDFTIVTPLGSIIDQAVNLFAQDTFITGKWSLKKESIVLLPEGTDTSELQDNPFKIVYYNRSEKSLRSAVDEVILNNKGVTFKMQGNMPAVGSYVLLDEGININTPSFFENLLKEKQGMLSFGDHTHSEVGDAAILGILRGVLSNLLTVNNLPSLQIARKPLGYVSYRIADIFYNKVKDKYFSVEEQVNFENLLSTQKVSKDFDDPLWTEISPEFFAMMNHMELQEFKTIYPEFFDGQPNQFEAAWAICRWLSIGHKRGLEEGLQKIIDAEISKFMEQDSESFYLYFTSGIFQQLHLHNNIHSSRLTLVKEILNLESFKRYKNAIESFIPKSPIEEILQEEIKNL